MTEFRVALNRALKERKMSHYALAKRLGLSKQAVYQWRDGICLPETDTFISVCVFLGLDINKIKTK